MYGREKRNPQLLKALLLMHIQVVNKNHFCQLSWKVCYCYKAIKIHYFLMTKILLQAMWRLFRTNYIHIFSNRETE